MRLLPSLLPIFLCALSSVAIAATELDCYKYEGCIGGAGGRSGEESANPSFGNQIKINPSAVPTEKGVGIEAILYKEDLDFSIVQGLGRVGAGISPSNNEETFFGPPGFETDNDLLDRKRSQNKYPKQKYTFASAMNVIKRTGGGLKSRSLQVGIMAKYNTKSYGTNGGLGMNGILGPFTFSGSIYDDETKIEDARIAEDQRNTYKYQVKTYSVGISLGSFLIDYSVLRSEVKDSGGIFGVRLLSGSLLVRRIILTLSKRIEDSNRSDYNYSTHALENKKIKEDYFAGLQLNFTKDLMAGLLYNYYQLHETSVIATYFF